MKVMIVPILIGALGTITEGLLKGLKDGRDYPNYSISENRQNPETSPGDMKRIAVVQTPVKTH